MKLNLGSIACWSGLLFFLFIVISVVYENSYPFASNFFMNAAFTVLGGLLIAIVLDQLFEARDKAHWFPLDKRNLQQAQVALSDLIYRGLFLTVQSTCRAAQIQSNADVQVYAHIAQPETLEQFTRDIQRTIDDLDILEQRHRAELGRMVLKNRAKFSTLALGIKTVINSLSTSPYTPIACLLALQEVDTWAAHLKNDLADDLSEATVGFAITSFSQLGRSSVEAYKIIYTERQKNLAQ